MSDNPSRHVFRVPEPDPVVEVTFAGGLCVCGGELVEVEQTVAERAEWERTHGVGGALVACRGCGQQGVVPLRW